MYRFILVVFFRCVETIKKDLMSSEDFNLTGVCSENELNDSMDELDQTSNTLLDDGLDDDQVQYTTTHTSYLFLTNQCNAG